MTDYFRADAPDFRAHMRRVLDPLVRLWLKYLPPRVPYPADLRADDIALFESVQPYTMTGVERVSALVNAVRYLTSNRIAGAIVECGVWRGGSMMVVAKTLLALGDTTRQLFLFDTFEGMTPPTDVDRDTRGVPATVLLAAVPRRANGDRENYWCLADEADVRVNIASTGYPMERVRLERGRVEETIPAHAPDAPIALLRLDTDWYESTRHELIHLYPRLAPGGVLIVDDYGAWQGARKAVDEYFVTLSNPPMLHRIDFTGRAAIKPH